MSLFQCEKCGCEENTALSGASHGTLKFLFKGPQYERALASYRIVLGLPEGAPLGDYCSVCCPIWYTKDGRDLGIGPNPEPTEGHGIWHGSWTRQFLPKGFYETDNRGDLWHKKTHEKPDKYYRDTEWPTLEQAVQEAIRNAVDNDYKDFLLKDDLEQVAIDMMDKDQDVEMLTHDGFHAEEDVKKLIEQWRKGQA